MENDLDDSIQNIISDLSENDTLLESIAPGDHEVDVLREKIAGDQSAGEVDKTPGHAVGIPQGLHPFP